MGGAVAAVETRLERLNAVSARQLREPEAEFPWDEVGKGQVLPDELLSINGLDLELTADQRATLAREEVASLLAAGIHFEAVLDAAFSLRLAYSRELDDPRHVYMLHEVGEETRHQRAFLRLREQLAPRAKNPFDHGAIAFVMRRAINIVLRSRALFCTLLLAGEEIPDFMQKLATEHPDTDPVLKAVNRYHRAEEARHLAFARMIMPEEWAKANALDRFRVRFSAPIMIRALFDGMVHPGVYATVGLPAFPTWKAAHRTPQRRAVRFEATRPVLWTLLENKVLRAGRVPRGWQSLCGVDKWGSPTDEIVGSSVREVDDHGRVI
ncbi:MAG TPA: diiron oxygenase [Acidimicrobiia bacterium]|nr:diiron oxygenase [Acidimicrobiia bacterium]